MKKYFTILTFSLLAVLFIGCSDHSGPGTDAEELPVLIEGFQLSLGRSDVSKTEATKAEVDDYAVNGTNDPTATLEGRESWLLHAVIYASGTYSDGESIFTHQNDNIWKPDSALYFPNYLTQQVSAELYPAGYGGIAIDQQTAENVFLSDLLEQNGDSVANVRPAHIPNIPLRHAHSMIDFILKNVDSTHIKSLTVLVDGNEYLPYKVGTGDTLEYLLILPVGSSYPVVRLKTIEGAEYRQRIGVNPTEPNRCYCVTLEGLELTLSTITVTNWAYGEAVAGTYSSIASYPTFRAFPDITLVVGYNNGLEQTLQFNSRGETTVRPFGRTITWLYYLGDTLPVDPPLVLREMIIDLDNYLPDSL